MGSRTFLDQSKGFFVLSKLLPNIHYNTISYKYVRELLHRLTMVSSVQEQETSCIQLSVSSQQLLCQMLFYSSIDDCLLTHTSDVAILLEPIHDHRLRE